MSFYKFYQAPVYVNGQNIATNQVSFSVNSSIAADYTVGNKTRRNIVATDGINGKINLSYYITGKDPLFDQFVSGNVISGSIASINFSNACIGSYSVGSAAKSFVKADVGILVYGNFSGNFLEAQLANISGIAARGGTTDFSGASIDNALSFNYSSSVDIKPSYLIGDYTATRIIFGKRQAQIEVESDKIQDILSITGNYAYTKVNLRQGCQTGIIQSYEASGNLTSLDFGGSTDGIGLIVGRAVIQDLV